MIFKKSKVLTDNIVDPVSGKFHRGHHKRDCLKAVSFCYRQRKCPTVCVKKGAFAPRHDENDDKEGKQQSVPPKG